MLGGALFYVVFEVFGVYAYCLGAELYAEVVEGAAGRQIVIDCPQFDLQTVRDFLWGE